MKTKTFFTFIHSEICSFIGKIFSCLKFRRVIVAFHVASFFFLSFIFTYSQAPKSFNYQAVARDNTGQVLKSQALNVKIGIMSGSATGTLQWEEIHEVTTNEFGLFTLRIGTEIKTGGEAPEFSAIEWNSTTHFLNVQVNNGSGYVDMGTTQLLSVPYALSASSVSDLKKLHILGPADQPADSAMFEVKNKDGQIVFAVYNEGVRIYVDTTGSKGPKGGFAVGGFSASKATPQEYLRVTPDSVRVYIDETISKGPKGGFAVGGFSASKGSTDLMHLNKDNYFIGHNSGSNITTGTYNSFFGYQAGMTNSTGSNNVFLGYKAGTANVGASENIFIGNESGLGNTSGSHNSFIGYQAGRNADGGHYNVFLGSNAGYNNTSDYNVFIGDKSGYANTSGHYNAFVGYLSGENNTEGTYNSFFGYRTGRNNTEGDWNAFFGFQAGYNNTLGEYNSFFGPNSGFYNTIGQNNSFLGYYSGFRSKTGSNNTFIGYRAGYSGTDASGSDNVYIGVNTGESNTTGHDNIGIGNLAGNSNTEGNYNVYIGTNAGTSNQTAHYNTMIGYLAGENTIEGFNTMVGYKAGQSNNSGDSQALFGYRAGWQNTGSRNTFIGTEAGYYSGSGGYNVYVGIAAGRSCTGHNNVFLGKYAGYGESGDNKLIIENNYTGSDNANNALIYGEFDGPKLRFNANVGINGVPNSAYALRISLDGDDTYGLVVYGDTWCSSGSWAGSDIRLKKNIRNFSNALSKVNEIRGVTFEWRKNEFPEKGFNSEQQIGMIAQEVEKVLPELVKKGPEGYKSIDYSKMSAVLVEAIKEQQKQIEELRKEIEALKKEKH